jgi:ADP-ribose pyrophosphatase
MGATASLPSDERLRQTILIKAYNTRKNDSIPLHVQFLGQFSKYDTDNQGTVTFEELQSITSEIGFSDAVKLTQLFERFQDKAARFQFKPFIEFIRNHKAASATIKRAKAVKSIHPIHPNSRGPHPSYPPRAEVLDTQVEWKVKWPSYSPVEHVDPVVLKFDCTKKQGGWADPADISSIDFRQRSSLCGQLKLGGDQRPQNPVGRTGLCNRGLLGKWGPNFAADPLITREDPSDSKKLQLVVIKRKDTGEWAFPGGMVDEGEMVSVTVRREFTEEAGNVPEEQKENYQKLLDKLFTTPSVVYKGYVDDPRNTDNSWMETTVMHFHCSKELGEMLPLQAGDDASHVRWLTLDSPLDADSLKLYADHGRFLMMAMDKLKRT